MRGPTSRRALIAAMSSLEHATVANVTAALSAAGQHEAAAGVRILPAEVRTAAQAADALGVVVGAIANSVIFRAEFPDHTVPLLVLTSGAHRANIETLRTLVSAMRVSKAEPEFVKQRTGQAIGGVAPVGHAEPITTLVGTALRTHPVVWAAAGHAKAVFPTTFADLLALTGARPVDVAPSECTR